jgi:hypothetical protein
MIVSPAEKNLLALLEALNASEPDDAVVLDDGSLDAVVDSAFDLLSDLRSPCPLSAADVLFGDAEDCHTGTPSNRSL